jgi:hypothetical protein
MAMKKKTKTKKKGPSKIKKVPTLETIEQTSLEEAAGGMGVLASGGQTLGIATSPFGPGFTGGSVLRTAGVSRSVSLRSAGGVSRAAGGIRVAGTIRKAGF